MKILRFSALNDHGVPYCREHVRRLERAGEFPARVHIGKNCVGWVADEVDRWVEAKIAARVAERDAGHGAPGRADGARSR